MAFNEKGRDTGDVATHNFDQLDGSIYYQFSDNNIARQAQRLCRLYALSYTTATALAPFIWGMPR
jgi:hypothetical protein